MRRNVSRRGLLKYVGAGAALGSAAVAGYGVSGLLSSLAPPPEEASTTTVVPTMTQSCFSQTAGPQFKEGYPLLACLDYWNWDIPWYRAEEYARWNMSAFVFETAHYSVEGLKQIKELNPETKILAWMRLGLFKPGGYGGYLETKFLNASTEDWWIHKKGAGPPSSRRLHMVTSLPEMLTPNPKSEFAEHLLGFMQEEVMSTGLYDGILYDCVWDALWIDSQLRDAEISCLEYREGVASLLKDTREKFGPDSIILCEGGNEWRQDCPYWDYANGFYQENALGDIFGNGWPYLFEMYKRNMNEKEPPPRMHWIGADTQCGRDPGKFQQVTRPDLTGADLKRMRLGLGTSLLLDNGYFGFDKGSGFHGYLEQWWFPEYDADLGLPRGEFQQFDNGTYMRRFDNGTVVVNPTGGCRTIRMEGGHRDVTSNASGLEFTLPPEDAIILIEV